MVLLHKAEAAEPAIMPSFLGWLQKGHGEPLKELREKQQLAILQKVLPSQQDGTRKKGMVACLTSLSVTFFSFICCEPADNPKKAHSVFLLKWQLGKMWGVGSIAGES